MRRPRTGELLWILCAQFFLAEQVTSHGWRLPYSFALNYISDLGAQHCNALICSPWHQVMNGSFVLQGFLIGAGALSLWTRFGGMGKFSLALLALCAGGVVLVGLAPSDQDPALHTVGGTTHFVAAGLGICVMGVALLQQGNSRLTGFFSVFTGIIVLTATATLGGLSSTSQQISHPVGAIERVGAYGIVLWLVVMGCRGEIAKTQ